MGGRIGEGGRKGRKSKRDREGERDKNVEGRRIKLAQMHQPCQSD